MQDELTKIAYQNATYYEIWQESEGIPVYRGYFLDDLFRLPLAHWQRMEARGAFINLAGAGRSCDGYVLEVDGGREILPQRHLFEEVLLVLTGRGATRISNEAGASHMFEWQPGSLFAPPLNTRYQHFAHGKDPVRLFAVTNAPVMLNQFRNRDFIFHNLFDFSDRYSRDPQYFATGREKPGRIFESNLVADVLGFHLKQWRERGAGGTNIRFELAENTLSAHVSVFPVGTYKKAHRHGPGAHVLILSGEGYSLFWQEGQDRKRIDWHKGTLLVPPELWFHQHFNTGAEPARYIALKPWGFKYLVDERFRTDEDVKSGGDQIEYADQDPEIHRLFVEACRLKGAPVRMSIG